jgi:hypothetical protein
MKNYERKSNWEIKDKDLLTKIVNSIILTEQEKLNFLRYIVYFTKEESQELAILI